ncbi:MAG: hypothetical protein LC121_01575 [Anaerolineae bacterium]|nr:hypothetical protein [Anaerolineae bacterium]
MNDRTVYISYRRRYGFSAALALFHALRAEGCDVFMDASAFNDRDEVDLAQIEARAHFLIVVAAGMIELLQKPDESLSREIEHAVAKRRNIVPLQVWDASFVAGALPKELGILRRYYGLPLAPEAFAGTVAALTEQRFQSFMFGTIVPTPPEHEEIVRQRIAEAASLPMPTNDELRAEIVFNRSLTRVRQDHEGRIADLDDALRLNPAHIEARFDRAVLRRRSGDESGAFADYDAVLALAPQYYRAYNNRAELYFTHRAYAKALADYERATALRPNYVMSLAGMALTLHALGRYDEAAGIWKPLAARDERFYDPLWVGRELRLPTAMIDEIRRLVQRLNTQFHAPDH